MRTYKPRPLNTNPCAYCGKPLNVKRSDARYHRNCRTYASYERKRIAAGKPAPRRRNT